MFSIYTSEMPETHPIVDTLQQASAGLLFMSETDAPFAPFFWPDSSGEELNIERFRQVAKIPEKPVIEVVKLNSFFRNATRKEDWHNAEEAAQAEKFSQLAATLKATLEDVQVFRVGETAIDVYIIGKTTGGFAGLQTKVVET